MVMSFREFTRSHPLKQQAAYKELLDKIEELEKSDKKPKRKAKRKPKRKAKK